jgi:hypothetical protein
VTKKFLIFLSVLFALLLFAGCAKHFTENEVKGFAQPITENLLTGFNEENYARFSQDFDEAMLKGIQESAFANLLSQIKGKIGNYVGGSIKFSTAYQQDSYIVVIYNATFTEETSDVTITISLEQVNGEYKVAGLYFNSPKLGG